jgi:hypothetical protein
VRAFLEIIFDWIFGCHHRHLSRVFTIDLQTYQVCFACGTKLRYSWRTMSLIKTERPQTLGVICNSVRTGNEQFAGSVVGEGT